MVLINSIQDEKKDFKRSLSIDPISIKAPSREDLYLTEKVNEMIKEKKLCETPKGKLKREKVLKTISCILNEWVVEVYISKNCSEHLPAPLEKGKTCAYVFTFGSYRLGVVTPGGDIDAVCIVPNFVNREEFFSSFQKKLKENSNITVTQVVPNAYTPLIKLQSEGIDVDLLFAQLSLDFVPDNLTSVKDDNLLKNVDEKTARSLNGCRVAEQLLSLSPNLQVFRNTLCFIKHWAKQRGIYSNIFGFLGGISWAIMVAYVCKIYPEACTSQLIRKFFLCFSNWDWIHPVILTPIVEDINEPGLMSFTVWNPRINSQDRYHLMPIITPSFPSMNTTHNVTFTTRQIILDELTRGYNLVESVSKGQYDWEYVVEPFDFFGSSDNYLELQVHGEDTMIYNAWRGWIESKIRFLIKRLEVYEMIRVHAWPYAIPIQNHPLTKSALYVAVHIPPDYDEMFLDLCDPIIKFVEKISTEWPDRNIYKNSIDLVVTHIRQDELPDYVLEYRSKQFSLHGQSYSNRNEYVNNSKQNNTSIVKNESIQNVCNTIVTLMNNIKFDQNIKCSSEMESSNTIHQQPRLTVSNENNDLSNSHDVMNSLIPKEENLTNIDKFLSSKRSLDVNPQINGSSANTVSQSKLQLIGQRIKRSRLSACLESNNSINSSLNHD